MSDLVLRGNNITDEGTRALAGLLSSSSDSGLRFIDLRENRISKQGIQVLADALERSNRVRHVYIHESRKIEAMGTDIQELSGGGEGWGHHEKAAATKSNVPLVKVETVCVVDIRSNNEPQGQNRTARNIVKGRSSSEMGAVDAPMLATTRTTVVAPSTKGVRNKVKQATKGPKSLKQNFAGGKSYKKSLINTSRGQGQSQLPMLPLSPKDNVAAAAISHEKKPAAANSQINKGQQALTSGYKQDVRVQ